MINEFDTKALTWDDNPQFVERSEKIANKIRGFRILDNIILINHKKNRVGVN